LKRLAGGAGNPHAALSAFSEIFASDSKVGKCLVDCLYFRVFCSAHRVQADLQFPLEHRNLGVKDFLRQFCEVIF